METIWILEDQLSPAHPALTGGPRPDAVILLIESRKRFAHLPYHQQRLVLILSALRHFAVELRVAGWKVDHHELEAAPDFLTALQRHVAAYQPTRLVVMEPNDWPMTEALGPIFERLAVPTELVPTNLFLCGREEFRLWAKGGKRLLMENHYRRMRVKTGWLVGPDGAPEGGAWNLDAENRRTFTDFARGKPPRPADPVREEPDALTRDIIALVEREFPNHPGRAAGFWLPVDRAGARRWLARFVAERLVHFGPFEDTMATGEPVLFHSVLSPVLNLGLISPAECVEAALAAYRSGAAPLNSVEGFVRQIIGWREFVNGIYWLRMPGYVTENGLGASRPLPAWLQTGETDLRCVRECVQQVLGTSFNHHIQRLMVLGNFFMLADIAPGEVLAWFNAMYCDAHDWVMAANVIGMILHADGGLMATKPYVAGSGYIERMSDYCEGCRYDPAVKTGPTACPFNYLYWSFYDRHGPRFAKNPRVAMMVRSWAKRSEADKAAVRASTQEFLARAVPLG